MSQTSVNAAGQSIGIAGQLADTGEGQDIVSGFNMEATSQMAFGFGLRVQPGSNGDGFLIATGFTNQVGLEVAGINTFSFSHNRAGVQDVNGNYSGDMGASGLLPKAGLQVLRKGRVLAPVEQNVVAGDRAWCRGIATGTSSISALAGIWAGTGYNTGANGSSYMLDCRRQGVFRSASYTAADGTTKVAVLEVDFTGPGF